MALTDAAIRAAKPLETLKKISDGGGLQLWISPSGTRLWYLAYRYGDKQKKLALGAYPVVSLAAARKHRDEAKALLASGVDPGQLKKANKIVRSLAEADHRQGALAAVAGAACARQTADIRDHCT